MQPQFEKNPFSFFNGGDACSSDEDPPNFEPDVFTTFPEFELIDLPLPQVVSQNERHDDVICSMSCSFVNNLESVSMPDSLSLRTEALQPEKRKKGRPKLYFDGLNHYQRNAKLVKNIKTIAAQLPTNPAIATYWQNKVTTLENECKRLQSVIEQQARKLETAFLAPNAPTTTLVPKSVLPR